MPQTYCTTADVEFELSVFGLTAGVDDNENNVRDPSPEDEYITTSIERGAVQLNMRLQNRYPDLTRLASNDWMRLANATLAAWEIAQRRMNTAPTTLDTKRANLLEEVEEIGSGSPFKRVPETADQFDTRPTVTNYDTVRDVRMPARVERLESTGPNPVPDVDRRYADEGRIGGNC